MEGFIHIYNKNRKFALSDSKIKMMINNLKNTNHSFRILRNNQITAVYYTNEYTDYPYNLSNDYLFCPAGQFTEDKNKIQQVFKTRDDKFILDYVEKLAGAFLISTVNLNTNTIDIYTHVVRAEGSFILDDKNNTIIGTDPLIVSAFSNTDLQPKFDKSNFISFLEQGYFADENTPFENVYALPENSHINVSESLTINNIDDTFKTAFSHSSSAELLNQIRYDFSNSFNILKNKNVPIRSGLTGGKDSRLILLALLDNNFEVNTHTTGFSDHPDVTVAKELSEILNVPHVINERKVNSDNQYVVNLEKRLIEIMSASSGLLSAYDSVSTKKDFKNNINFNGVAASVLSGGFNNFNHNIGNLTKTQAIKNALYKFDDFYLDKENKYVQFLEEFSMQNDDYRTLLHLFFLKYRTGRWTSDSRIPKSYSSNSFSIFLDNQLTKSAMKLNMDDLRNEVIHYTLIKQLNPEVLNVPFFNQRFAFEKDAPLQADDYSNWLKREPVYATSKMGTYNWRSLGNNDPVLVNAFKDIILSNKNNQIFDIVDYSKIEELFNSKLTNRTNKFIWSLASMIKFTDTVNNKNISDSMKIKLKIPSDKIIQAQKHPEIYDLTEFYTPLNNSITFDIDTKHIRFTDNEGNPYLKTFSGGFSVIPASKNISNVKNINFNTCMELNNEDDDIRMSIIFYTEKKRFKTVIIDSLRKNNTQQHFCKSVEVPKQAVYFRTAIYFKNRKTKSHQLKYSYAVLNYAT